MASETQVRLSEVERLEAKQKELAEAKKENAKRLKAAKRREARKREQAKKKAEMEEAVRIWEFCKRANCSIGVTINGEQRSMQLADYIRYQMGYRTGGNG